MHAPVGTGQQGSSPVVSTVQPQLAATGPLTGQTSAPAPQASCASTTSRLSMEASTTSATHSPVLSQTTFLTDASYVPSNSTTTTDQSTSLDPIQPDEEQESDGELLKPKSLSVNFIHGVRIRPSTWAFIPANPLVPSRNRNTACASSSPPMIYPLVSTQSLSTSSPPRSCLDAGMAFLS